MGLLEKTGKLARSKMIEIESGLEEISRDFEEKSDYKREILSEQFQYYAKIAGYGPKVAESYLRAYTLGINTRMKEEESSEINFYNANSA